MLVDGPPVAVRDMNNQKICKSYRDENAALVLALAVSCVVFICKLIAIANIPTVFHSKYRVLLIVAGAAFGSAGDIAAILISGTMAAVICHIAKSRILRKIIIFGYALILFEVSIILIANIEVTRVFGTPLSAGLIYYADLFGSESGRIALWSWIPNSIWMAIAIAVITCGSLLTVLLRIRTTINVLIIVIILSLVGAAKSGNALRPQEIDRAYLQSEIQSLILSFRSLPQLTEAETAAIKPRPKGREQLGVPLSIEKHAKPRNVIFVVLESTSAEYLDLFGGHFSVTPNLQRLATQSIILKDAYSHSVASHISLVSMLTSSYPWISMKTITQSERRFTVPDLASELRRAGYKSAFFHSSDTRHSHVDVFLSHTGFDKIEDFRSRTCADAHLIDESEFNSQASTDHCTFDAVAKWIDQVSDKPFFAMIWTFQQHYPYFQTHPGKTYVLGEISENKWATEHKTRYLNAITEADEAIGKLIDHLRSTGVLDDTLIVVTGDHGESFGQHGSYGHGNNLFQEDIHVPLLFSAPGLFPVQVADRIVGHIDIAPSILDILGLEVPKEWQGTSIFKPTTEKPIYFFTAWVDYKTGSLIGAKKTIVHWLENFSEAYDLIRDPEERKGQTTARSSERDAEAARIKGWVSNQNAWIERHLN